MAELQVVQATLLVSNPELMGKHYTFLSGLQVAAGALPDAAQDLYEVFSSHTGRRGVEQLAVMTNTSRPRLVGVVALRSIVNENTVFARLFAGDGPDETTALYDLLPLKNDRHIPDSELFATIFRFVGSDMQRVDATIIVPTYTDGDYYAADVDKQELLDLNYKLVHTAPLFDPSNLFDAILNDPLSVQAPRGSAIA